MEPDHAQLRKKILLVIICLVVCIIIASLWLISGSSYKNGTKLPKKTEPIQSQQNVPVLSVEPDVIVPQIQGWNTYTNKKYGIEFQYPPQWPEPTINLGGAGSYANETPYQFLTINFLHTNFRLTYYFSSFSSSSEYDHVINLNSADQSISTEPITINGYKGFFFSTSTTQSPKKQIIKTFQTYINIALKNKKNAVVLINDAIETKNASTYIAQLHDLISTIHLTPSDASVFWPLYHNEDLKFEITYPTSWKHGVNDTSSSFSLVFCPQELSSINPGEVCQGSPITLHIDKTNPSQNPSEEKGTITDIAGIYTGKLILNDPQYESIYDKMLETFRFYNGYDKK